MSIGLGEFIKYYSKLIFVQEIRVPKVFLLTFSVEKVSLLFHVVYAKINFDGKVAPR